MGPLLYLTAEHHFPQHVLIKEPPQRNFTDIGIISGFFDDLHDKSPLPKKEQAAFVVSRKDKAAAAPNKFSLGPSKRKKRLPLCSNEIFLKLAEDTTFSDAMDSAEKALVGWVRGRHYSVKWL